MCVTERELRDWWLAQRVDVRDLVPPPGACTERVHRRGDPSSPCVRPAGHEGECEDIEGYIEY